MAWHCRQFSRPCSSCGICTGSACVVVEGVVVATAGNVPLTGAAATTVGLAAPVGVGSGVFVAVGVARTKTGAVSAGGTVAIAVCS